MLGYKCWFFGGFPTKHRVGLFTISFELCTISCTAQKDDVAVLIYFENKKVTFAICL